MEKIKFLLIIFTLPFIFACFQSQAHKDTSTGVYHLVKKSETIEGIARTYGVPVQQLIRVNNIKADNPVKEGSVIFVPSASRVESKVIADTTPEKIVRKTEIKKNIDSSVKDSTIKKQEREVKPFVEVTDIDIAKPKKASIDVTKSSEPKKSKIVIIAEPEKTTVSGTIKSGGKETAPSPKNVTDEKTAVKIVSDKKGADDRILTPSPTAEPAEKITAGKNKFIWPVRGEVKAHFGKQPNKTFHNWIKIVSAAGVKVKAAEAGTVIFSSNLKNYGETIIIRHRSNFATVYTHLKKRNVKIDKAVKKGETIAVLGEKDEDGAVYMNFEIRLQGKARNPLLFLL
ncbi:MAG: M23 family metallopeptidase [Smithella sp.]